MIFHDSFLTFVFDPDGRIPLWLLKSPKSHGRGAGAAASPHSWTRMDPVTKNEARVSGDRRVNRFWKFLLKRRKSMETHRKRVPEAESWLVIFCSQGILLAPEWEYLWDNDRFDIRRCYQRFENMLRFNECTWGH